MNSGRRDRLLFCIQLGIPGWRLSELALLGDVPMEIRP
jgi:hypothetical protein